jgi:hypothetical protein
VSSGEWSRYVEGWEGLSEEDLAKAMDLRAKQTYTKGDTGQTVNAVKSTKASADMRARNFAAYMEMTGKPKPTQSDMEKWLQGHKSAYKTAMGLASNSRLKTDVVMDWLRAKNKAEGTV